ncbi:ArfGap-domain-containing protein [Daedalea quercina L-15889]|uniref:ArfGap-domain-containing protein n=1 Tax=Daedalea quercina L-15889 TaxID=1314783 RepID=A0A165KJ95_9APHY|nr:ArfGap-domain-containing protein [Daedalea quercina L-15889]
MNKIAAERNQRTLLELANMPGNDVCADCKARNPRWASHNLGIFICMNCASIHRKMGTHISKVKSLTMDTWTREQVEHMKNTGNVKCNSYYNPNETRHPPPTNMVDSERDSDLEKYIRSKYEFKSFINRAAAAAALLGPSKSLNRLSPGPQARSQTVLTTATNSTPSAPPPVPPKNPSPAPPPVTAASSTPAQLTTATPSTFSPPSFRSVSQPVSSSPTTFTSQTSFASGIKTQSPSVAQQSSTWAALASLQSPSSSVQPSFTPSQSLQSQTQQTNTPSFSMSPNPFSGLSASPSSPFPSSVSSISTRAGQDGVPRSASLGTGLALNVNVGSPMGSLTPGGSSPFQTQTTLGASSPFQPSPSPFQPQINGAPSFQPQQALGLGLSAQNMNPYAGLSTSPMGTNAFAGQPTGSFQSQSSPYMQTNPLQPQPSPQPSPFQQQQQMFQPQMPMQSASSTNPFFQTQSPVAAQPQAFPPSPSPFGQPQMQQPMHATGNPFNNWQGQQQQMGFAGQHWTGM